MSAAPSNTIVAMMLAMDRNKLIGKDGGMPWHIPGELAYFKQVTMGKPLIMGRKTFDSLGKPLPGRPNIVVTRNAQWRADGVTACTSLEAAIVAGRAYYDDTATAELSPVLSESTSAASESASVAPKSPTTASQIITRAAGEQELMVIGGAGLCREAMPITQRIYLTKIDNVYAGDIYFDSFNDDDWHESTRVDNEQDGLRYSYFVLERANGLAAAG